MDTVRRESYTANAAIEFTVGELPMGTTEIVVYTTFQETAGSDVDRGADRRPKHLLIAEPLGAGQYGSNDMYFNHSRTKPVIFTKARMGPPPELSGSSRWRLLEQLVNLTVQCHDHGSPSTEQAFQLNKVHDSQKHQLDGGQLRQITIGGVPGFPIDPYQSDQVTGRPLLHLFDKYKEDVDILQTHWVTNSEGGINRIQEENQLRVNVVYCALDEGLLLRGNDQDALVHPLMAPPTPAPASSSQVDQRKQGMESLE